MKMFRVPGLLFLIWAVCLPGAFAQQQMIDRIAAVVDDEIILESEVNQYALNLAYSYKINPQTDPDKFETLKKQAIDILVNQKILLAQAKLDSIEVSEDQVEQTLNDNLQNMIKQFGSQKAFEEYYGLSLERIRKQYRDEVRKQIMVQQIQGKKFRNVSVSRSEIEDFFSVYRDSLEDVGESVNISHILMEIKPGEETLKKALDKAKLLVDSLNAGSSFERLAKEYSDDPGSASKGGELGWFDRNAFVKEFAQAATALEVGERSGIVKTEYGFHIIQLQGKKGNQINTRHILIASSPGEEDKIATFEKLTQVRQDILDGKITFEEAAQQYSDDPEKKGNQGNLGWIEVNTMKEQAYLDAIAGLQIGEICQPFETAFGLHIVLLKGTRGRRKVNLKEDWQFVEQLALEKKRADEFQNWLQSIKKDFYIDVRM